MASNEHPPYFCPVCMTGGSIVLNTDNKLGAALVLLDDEDDGRRSKAFVAPCPRDRRHMLCFECYSECLKSEAGKRCLVCRARTVCVVCNDTLLGDLCTVASDSAKTDETTTVHVDCAHRLLCERYAACRAALSRIRRVHKNFTPATHNTPSLARSFAYPRVSLFAPRAPTDRLSAQQQYNTLLWLCRSEWTITEGSIRRARSWMSTCVLFISMGTLMASATQRGPEGMQFNGSTADFWASAWHFVFLVGTGMSFVCFFVGLLHYLVLCVHPLMAIHTSRLVDSAEELVRSNMQDSD